MERKNHDNKPVLYIVVPCYNEEEVLPITSGLFKEKIEYHQQKESPHVND